MVEYIGILLILLGLYWLYKLTINNKPVLFFNFTDNEKSVYINNIGNYAVSTVKGRFITIQKGFKISIKNSYINKSNVVSKELKIRNKTYNKWHIGVEFLKFNISEQGQYTIKVENPNNLIVKEPRFFTKSRVLDIIEPNDVELALEKYYPFYYRILAALIVITGIFMLIRLIVG